LASGGGIPQGCMSILYGPESAGKTNLALRFVRSAQQMFPDQTCVFVDVERSLDKNWCDRMGIDSERLGHLKPAYGEDAVDWTEAALSSSDVSLVVLDSIAAITPGNTVEKEAGRMDVAGNSALISRLMSKVTFAQQMAAGQDHYPTLLCINQVRFKIGVMFGDPETQPGGKKLHHAARMIARIYGKNEVDKSIHAELPAWKKTNIVLKKWKVPIVNPQAQYNMAMIPAHGVKPGEVDDWPTLKTYLSELGWMLKTGQKWMLLDKEYPTQKAIRELVMADNEFTRNLRKKIIDTMLDKMGIESQ